MFKDIYFIIHYYRESSSMLETPELHVLNDKVVGVIKAATQNLCMSIILNTKLIHYGQNTTIQFSNVVGYMSVKISYTLIITLRALGGTSDYTFDLSMQYVKFMILQISFILTFVWQVWLDLLQFQYCIDLYRTSIMYIINNIQK